MKGGMEWIRKTYNVPAKRGRKVCVWNWRWPHRWEVAFEGTITSACRGGPYLWIRNNKEAKTTGPFHPTFGIEYLNDDGSTLLDARTRHDTLRAEGESNE